MFNQTNRPTGRLRGLLLALALLLAPLLGLAATPAHAQPLPGNCTQSGSTITCTYGYTGAAATWTVPAGVTSATFDLYGAQGSINSGLGGRVTATLALTPGQTYQVRVGGWNGYNGGGSSGSGRNGGGASDVRGGTFGLAERLLVAGGGGGGTAFNDSGVPNTAGAGGYPNGNAGRSYPDAPGGSGGTQSAGGAAGGSGYTGSLGQGGNGSGEYFHSSFGGGGGGGYYGGGGGGSSDRYYGGGGGGSSYATPAATGVSYQTGVRQGDGVRSADGLVIISYALTDTTAPVATPTHTPAPAPSGWNNGPVTVSWNWVDPIDSVTSGIDPANCTTSSVANGSATVTVTATCRDLAGNVGSATYQVRIDPTAPIANPTQTPAANTAGWNSSDVTVSWNWGSTGAVVDTANCTNSLTSSGEGTLTLSATCHDVANNQRTVPYTVKVDKTAPTISAAATASPNAAGWYTGDVSVAFSCNDALSGLAGTCPANQTLSGEGSSVSASAQSVSDLAGNSATSNVVTVQIDRSAPTVSVTGVRNGATYLFGAVPTAACATTDALSGVASAATLTLSGGTLAGTGSFTATCAGASDKAGNSAAPVSVSYTVAGVSITRRAPVLYSSSRVEGPLWLLNGENTTIDGTVTGDLLVPGTPQLVRNGGTLGSIVVGSGSPEPSGYGLTLNSGASVNRLITRIYPIALPPVPAPPTPTGTRDVTINQAGQPLGDPATIRNLTLNSGAGAVALPAGNYGQLTAHGSSWFVLGVAGASTPSVYNLQGLTLNGSRLTVVGPVVINLANGFSLNGQVGVGGQSGSLVVNVAVGSVQLNSGSALFGTLRAPFSNVTVNSSSRLEGTVLADRLVLNGGTVRATP